MSALYVADTMDGEEECYKVYVLMQFTSKHVCACVCTQVYWGEIDNKQVVQMNESNFDCEVSAT